MIIDAHSHAFPLEGLVAMEKLYPELIKVHQYEADNAFAVWAETPLPAWNSAKRMEKMHQAGIDKEILQNPIIYHKVDKNAPFVCQVMNRELAGICLDNPENFDFLASVPLMIWMNVLEK
ncbi:MAG: hypothetical protein GY750_08240 [Lentisphaerae bacterium]|nr:hypothetical protein [Lentisphaerota bacterium]MCP4101398.1 hypothetical protein [Lentisphaerota bacterium]